MTTKTELTLTVRVTIPTLFFEHRAKELKSEIVDLINNAANRSAFISCTMRPGNVEIISKVQTIRQICE